MAQAKRETHIQDVEHEFEGDGTQVLDLMSPSGSQAQRFQRLTVVDREFAYHEVDGSFLSQLDNRGDVVQIRNMGRSLEYEAFMQEPVIIIIQETTDKNAPPIVFVGDNGDDRWLPRGTPIKLPRKYVERLAQAKERSISTKQLNGQEDMDERMPARSKEATAYPFSVLKDWNPLGAKWLRRVAMQGT